MLEVTIPAINLIGSTFFGSAILSQTELARVALLFAEGFALHQAGRLVDAENIYNRILAPRPDHFDSLHLPE